MPIIYCTVNIGNLVNMWMFVFGSLVGLVLGVAVTLIIVRVISRNLLKQIIPFNW